METAKGEKINKNQPATLNPPTLSLSIYNEMGEEASRGMQLEADRNIKRTWVMLRISNRVNMEGKGGEEGKTEGSMMWKEGR